MATSGASPDPHVVEPAPPCAGALRAAAHTGRIAPRAFNDADVERIVLEVVREDGRPIAGAGVQASFESVALAAVTDAEGRASLYAYRDTVARVGVSRSDFVTEWQEVALDPGVRRLVVPTRLSVVGHVLIRGQPPSEPVRIGLTLQFGPPLSVLSDASGDVEFFNLPENWAGEFTHPKGYRREQYLTSTGPFSSRLFYPPPRPVMTTTLTPPPTHPAIANVAVIALPGYVDVGTFLSPTGPPVVEDQPFDKPGIIVDWYERYGLYDANTINLIPTREIAITILDSSGNPVVGATAGARARDPDIGDERVPTIWWSYSFATGENGRTVLTADVDAVAGGLRSALLVFLPGCAGLAPDDATTSTNESGEESVTLRVTVPAPIPITDPIPIVEWERRTAGGPAPSTDTGR